MSNLIQYIIQDDPEQEMKKKQSQSLLSRESSSQEDTGKNYKFSSRHLLENNFSHLQSKPASTARSYLSQALTNSMAKEGNKVSSALSPKPIGNDATSFKIAQNNKGNMADVDIPRYWDTEKEGKKIYDYVLQKEGKGNFKNQNLLDYTLSAAKGATNIGKNFIPMKKMKVTDKFKHAVMNCKAAQFGEGGVDIAKLASDLREWLDVKTGSNTLDSSNADDYANKIGRLLGRKYPHGDCNEIIQKYIKKNW